MSERKLLRNRAMCRKCMTIIESKHRHDFQRCSCGAIFVDGGLAYSRGGWPDGDPEDWILDLCEYGEIIEETPPFDPETY